MIEILNSRCRKNIEEIQNKIKKIKSETLTSKKELRTLYINAFMLIYHRRATGIDLNGSTKSFEEIIEKESLFEQLQDDAIIKYTSQGHSMNGIKFEDLEKKVDAETKYENRKKLIENSTDDTIEVLQSKIEKENNRILEYSSMSISELLSEYEVIKLDKKLELIENADELTLYLLRNSYIDIYYPFYISYYHGKSDKPEDRQFILSNLNEKPKEFNFKISEIKKIVEVLTPKFFSKKAILNISLVDFLLVYREIYKTKFTHFIQHLADEEESSKAFIDFYKSKGKHPEILIQELAPKWENLWLYISNTEYREEKIIEYFKLIIENVDRKNILLLNKNNRLASYINKENFILNYFIEFRNKGKIKDILSDLDIKFEHIELIEDEEISKYILENSHYSITYHNIKAALIFLEEVSSEEVANSNYSTINEISFDPLTNYIEENIETYVQDVFLRSEAKEELPKYIAELLNNKQLTKELKLFIIQEKPIKIDDLSLIKDLILQTELLKNKKTVVSWKNLLAYFKSSDKTINDEFINYLNEPVIFNEITKHNLQVDEENDEIEKNLSESLLYAQNLSQEAYEKIVQAFPKNWSNLKLEKIPSSRLDFLIDEGYLALDYDNFEYLLENESPLHIKLIIVKFEVFKSNLSVYDLTDWDFGLLLDSDEISSEEKAEIIFLSNEEYYIEHPDLGEKVCQVISNTGKKLSSTNLLSLFDNCDSVINRMKVFNSNISRIDFDEAKELISKLPEPFDNLLIERKRTGFDINETNNQFFENLKVLGIISSATPKNGKIEVVTSYNLNDPN